MEIAALFVTALLLYAALYWLSCVKDQMHSGAKFYLAGSGFCVAFLGAMMHLSIFCLLFSAAGVLVVSEYVGSIPRYKYGKTFRNGVIGGFWLWFQLMYTWQQAHSKQHHGENWAGAVLRCSLRSNKNTKPHQPSFACAGR